MTKTKCHKRRDGRTRRIQSTAGFCAASGRKIPDAVCVSATMREIRMRLPNGRSLRMAAMVKWLERTLSDIAERGLKGRRSSERHPVISARRVGAEHAVPVSKKRKKPRYCTGTTPFQKET